MPEPHAYNDYAFLPHVQVTDIDSDHLRGVAGDFGWKEDAVWAMPGGFTEIFTRGGETLELGWVWPPDDSDKTYLLSPLYINDKEWHISSVDDVTRVLEEQQQEHRPELNPDTGEPSEIAATAAPVERTVPEEIPENATSDRLTQNDVHVSREVDLPEVAGPQVPRIAVEPSVHDNPAASVDVATTVRGVDRESSTEITANPSTNELGQEGWGFHTLPAIDSGLAPANAGESELSPSLKFDTTMEVSDQLCHEVGGELDPEIDM